MKKFVQIFKIPLIIFTCVFVIGIVCKVIADNRPKVEFVRNNSQCTTERVFDYADKLTEEQEEELREKIREAELLCGTDIVFVILDQSLEEYAKAFESVLGYLEPYEYTMVFADNFYDEGEFGYDMPHGDGVLFVDNWYRESDGGVYSWISTSGRAMNELSADNCEYILDMALDYVEDDPAYAYGYLVDLMEDYLNPNTKLGEGLGGGISVLIGLVAGVIFFFANFGGKKGKKTIQTRTYVKSQNADVVERQDIFLTKTMSRRRIETQTRSGGGGGHISAGGHSHGGGGHRR